VLEVKRNHKWCHNGTVNLTIKNIPEEIHRILKRTAAERGRSLNAQVILGLEEAANDAERRRRMRENHDAMTRRIAKMPKLPSSVSLIREDRDRR
jgi:plasmid stability protein